MLKAIRRGGWFLPLNLALLVTAVLLIGAGMTMTFHVTFVLLTLAAFLWSFRTFVLGAIFWVAVTSGGLLLSVYRGQTSPDELIDIPLLTSILLLIFMIAHRRSRAQAQVAKLLATEQERVRRLRELAVLKNDFSAMVAHELVSPIAALRVRVEMLEEKELPPADQDQIVAAIKGDVNMLAGLASEVQAAAQVERDDFTTQPRRVALADLIDSATRFFDTLPGGHALIVEAQADGCVWADAYRIDQVLRNLLSNAAKYAPEHTPIRLRTMCTENRSGKERVRIEIADEGPGIHPDDLSHVFEKFGRGRDGTGKKTAGAGLGLYTSRRIVQAHGSELTVHSASGEGSAFSFELDVAGDDLS